ncbi:MAG TPA: glycosyl hydrolase [Solirubrobacteraceae bacterium]
MEAEIKTWARRCFRTFTCAIVAAVAAVAPAAAHAVHPSKTWTLQRHVAAPGLYKLDFSVASPRSVRRERVVVVVQHVRRRGVVVTHKRVHIRMSIRLAGQPLTARLSGHSGAPRVSASVRLLKPRTPSSSQVFAAPLSTQPQASTAQHQASASQPLAYGAYISGVPEYPSLLDQFSANVGRKPSIVMWYRYFTEQIFSAPELQALDSRGEAPMVTWEPWNPDHTSIPLKAITSGSYDSTIIADAQAAAAWGKPVFLRFAQEMNGHWFPWGLGVNGNTAADFIAAWRHIVTVFRAHGASNVRFVWSPNEMDSGTPGFQQLYPGDAYVDWVAVDGYNFGSTTNNTWQSFTQVFSASYTAMTSLTSKPMMVAETGSVEQGGSKAAWITSALQTELPNRFPRIRAVVWFNKNYDGFNWLVDSSSSSLSAFRTAVDSSLYSLSGSSFEAIPTV